MSSDLQDQTKIETRLRRTRNSSTSEPDSPKSCNLYVELGDQLAYPAEDPFAHKMEFRVDLSMFRGPLDLLLFLVRKHELDIQNIPISMVTEQYIQYMDVLEEMSVDEVGDFVEVASLLIEIKSRMVLPRVEENVDGQQIDDDPRQELVERLLEYKKYKDAASMLGESGHEWQQRFPRVANDLPSRTVDPGEQPIHEVELWDLVSAIGRVMRESERLKPQTKIVYDDTPISVYMQRIHETLISDGIVHFTSMFEPGMHKARMIGIFLAILELTRNYGVVVEQRGLHGEMIMRRGDNFKTSLEMTEVFSGFNEQDSAEPDANDADSEVVESSGQEVSTAKPR